MLQDAENANAVRTALPRPLWDGQLLLPILAIALAAAVISSGLARLHFGVDLTDESYYAALAYRFALGDVPYVADMNVRQNAAIITWPAVELWLRVTGGVAGLVLFLRYVYFGVRLALTVLAARALWRRAPTPAIAVIASLVPCAYVFLLIPALSYNTIAGTCVSAALCCFLLWRETAKVRYAALSMILGSVGGFAHPAVVPVSVALLAIILWRAEPPRRPLIRLVALLAAAWFVILGLIALGIGRENVEHFIRTAGAHAGPPAQLSTLLGMGPRLLQLSHGGIALVALWAGLWFVRAMPPLLKLALISAFVGLAMIADNQAVMAWLALGSVPICWSSRDSARDDLTVVASISLTAGVLIGAFSTNSAINIAAGADVAVMAFMVGATKVLRPVRALFPTLLVALIVVRLGLSQWMAVYRDDRIIKLTRTVPDGPYRGLKTTPRKSEYIDGLQRALDTASRGKRSLVAFNGIPGAHLMVGIPPALSSTWIPDYPLAWAIELRTALAQALDRAPRPMLVLQMKHMYISANDDEYFTYSPDDVFMRALTVLRPKLVLDTPDFTLYEITQDQID